MKQSVQRHEQYTKRFQQWKKIRDCIEGEDEVKLGGQLYLPKPSGMNADQYKAYVQRSMFYSAADRTTKGLNGLVFRKEPTINLPKQLEGIKSSNGYSLRLIIEEVVREVSSIGRYGLLLDMGQEVKNNQAPFISLYYAEDILDWSEFFDGIETKKNMVLLREKIDQDFENHERYIELRITNGVYTVQRFETVEKSKELISGEILTPLINGKPLDYIPFSFVNPFDMRPDIEKPPLLDMVNISLSHYHNSADYEHSLYLTAQPTPYISGQIDESKKPTSIGSGTIWYLPEGASAGMLEFKGAGLSALKTAMDDKVSKMAAMGANMIMNHERRNESEETARMRSNSDFSLLNNIVNTSEHSINWILSIAAEWVKSNANDVDVKINKDFISSKMNHNDLMAQVKSWQSGAISRKTMYENLQQGEIANSKRDYDDEIDLINSDMGLTNVFE